ncbi:MAG TPA: RNA-binding protein [Planctomycetes bacterium]|nr:RNA-binding protein [Planctomycetota bacterium]
MSKRLFIGNLAWSTTEDSLRAALEEGGRTCESVRIIMDRETGRPRGFAFAEMASEEDTQAVIGDLNGQELDGRPLRVNEAEDRPPRRDGGGGGGGGGGGYRGGGGGGGGGGGYRGGGGGGGGGWDGKRGGKRGDSGGGGGDSGGDSWGDNW